MKRKLQAHVLLTFAVAAVCSMPGSARAASLHSSTLLGSFNTRVNDVAVDARGATYLTGFTADSEFPTTPGALAEEPSGFASEAFVAKLSPDGSTLEYATFLGGSSSDEATGIAVDPQGTAYVTGDTGSSDFPTTAGGFDRTKDGSRDGFVVKLAADGTHLEYGTYLGGAAQGPHDPSSGQDYAEDIALDEHGSAYVTGVTYSSGFPTTPGAFHRAADGTIPQNAFVTKFAPDGAGLAYSTYLPGSSHDYGYGIAVDGSGHAYVTGATSSSDFATTPGAYDTAINFAADVFVTKLAPDGATLSYSTYIGGGSSEGASGIAVDDHGSAYVTGRTVIHESWQTTAYPTTPGAYDQTPDVTGNEFNGDMFVTKLSPGGADLMYSTALGDTGEDIAKNIAVDPQGRAHLTGMTDSPQFPVTADAFDSVHNGGFDLVVARLSVEGARLAYSTFLGGTGNDSDDVTHHQGLAVDETGTLHVGAATRSADYPTTPGAFKTTFTGSGYLGAVSRLALPAPDECKVIGAGKITTENGDSARFAGTARFRAGESSGNPRYRSLGPGQFFFIRSVAVDLVECEHGQATVFGEGVLGRSTPVSYRIELLDRGPRGREDAYRIVLSNGYDSGLRPLDSGSIRVR